MNPDKANVHLSIDRASSGLSSDAQSLNTTEPIALYLNAECDESSPKSDIDQHKFTTELVIDNGFVVHDSEIQTNTKKEGNSNQNQTNKPSQKVIQSSKEKVKNGDNFYLINYPKKIDTLSPPELFDEISGSLNTTPADFRKLLCILYIFCHDKDIYEEINIQLNLYKKYVLLYILLLYYILYL